MISVAFFFSGFGFGRKKEDGVRPPQLPVLAEPAFAALWMLKHHPGLDPVGWRSVGVLGQPEGTAPRAGTARGTLVCLVVLPAWFTL